MRASLLQILCRPFLAVLLSVALGLLAAVAGGEQVALGESAGGAGLSLAGIEMGFAATGLSLWVSMGRSSLVRYLVSQGHGQAIPRRWFAALCAGGMAALVALVELLLVSGAVLRPFMTFAFVTTQVAAVLLTWNAGVSMYLFVSAVVADDCRNDDE